MPRKTVRLTCRCFVPAVVGGYRELSELAGGELDALCDALTRRMSDAASGYYNNAPGALRALLAAEKAAGRKNNRPTVKEEKPPGDHKGGMLFAPP